MSDLLRVPYAEAMAVPLPTNLSPIDCAAVGCNLVDIYRTIAPHLGEFPNARVLILSGLAPNMALYAVVLAKALGASSIDFVDSDPQRIVQAEALGARPLSTGSGGPAGVYPIIVDCSGNEKRLRDGLMALAPDGVCTSVWPMVGSFKLPVGAMFLRNGHYITGQPHALALIEPILALMQKTGISTRSIPIDVLPWEDASKAFGYGKIKRVFVRD